MALKRFATAHWAGDIQTGKGAISTPQSGLFADQNFSFKTRFGDETGTNPEELLAAAHAGCFSMALSAVLGRAGFTPTRIDTRAEATMDPGVSPGPTVTGRCRTFQPNNSPKSPTPPKPVVSSRVRWRCR